MSYYLINEQRIDENCSAVKNAFSCVPFRPAYSVKTNHVPSIIKRFHGNGFLVEVVSDMEVEFAEATGIPLSDIVYNGSMKGERARDVARAGGIVVFDSIDDYKKYLRNGNPCRCMFRVAVDIDNGVDTRFGIDPSNITEAIKQANRDGFSVVGIHCHVTKGRSLEMWRRKLHAMAHVYETVAGFLSEHIVDMGGNMYSNISQEMRSVFPHSVTYEEYADLFLEVSHLFTGATFMLEMGTSVVSDCVEFHANVLSIKKTDRNTFVLVDAVNYSLGWAAKDFNHPVRVERRGGDLVRVTDAKVVGRLCTEDDVMHRGLNMDIAVGDELVFENVGSYTIVVKPPFIVPQYPIYSTTDGIAKCLVKRAETASDLLVTYGL